MSWDGVGTVEQEFSAIGQCRDFKVLMANLTPEELVFADWLCVEHDDERCGCEYAGENDFHCLAGRWLENCITTQDFIVELKWMAQT